MAFIEWKEMGTIEQFEVIEAWKKARELVQVVYSMTTNGTVRREFALRDQIRRAGMSNFFEGFDFVTDRKFIHVSAIPTGSFVEMKLQLHVALDPGCITKARCDEAPDLATHVTHVFGAFIRYLTTAPMRGSQYRTN